MGKDSKYRHIFEHTSVAILEEDVSKMIERLRTLKQKPGMQGPGTVDIKKYLLQNLDLLKELISLVEITDGNQAAVQFFNCTSKKELIGPLSRVFSDGAYESYVEEIEAILQGKETFNGETIYIFPDKEKHYFLKQITLPPKDAPEQPLIVSFIDITKQKNLAAELEHAQTFLQRIINTAADPIFVKDSQHCFVEVNKAFCEFLDREREEIIGKSDPDFFPEDQVDVFWRNDDEVFTSGKMSLEEELFTNARGETRVIITRKQPYREEDGKQFLVGVIRDITEQKKAFETNKYLLSELRHRVKNSFSVIGGLLNCEIDDCSDPSTIAVVNRIKNRIDSISTLYSILYVSDTLETIQLDDYIRQIVSGLESSCTSSAPGITIRVETDSIFTRPKKGMSFGLIVNELLTNALKYAFPNGTEGTIRVELREREGTMQLIVADNGTGMDPHKRKESGLGLRLVEMLADQHNGTVTLESGGTYGNGTAVTVRIPSE